MVKHLRTLCYGLMTIFMPLTKHKQTINANWNVKLRAHHFQNFIPLAATSSSFSLILCVHKVSSHFLSTQNVNEVRVQSNQASTTLYQLKHKKNSFSSSRSNYEKSIKTYPIPVKSQLQGTYPGPHECIFSYHKDKLPELQK